MEKGDILTFAEFKQLQKTEGNYVHVLYYDDTEAPDNLCCDDFQIVQLANNPKEGYCGEFYDWPVPLGYADDKLISNIDNCGWTFTLRKVL